MYTSTTSFSHTTLPPYLCFLWPLQVPSWLDLSNPRVTVVPHSSIFANASHLPTFNSNAIQANLANIPGLAPHFIMMDDDLFLTAPWTRSDFLGPDGGQVLTGKWAGMRGGRFDLRLCVRAYDTCAIEWGHTR